jgi:hypothetical protein
MDELQELTLQELLDIAVKNSKIVKFTRKYCVIKNF